MKKWIWILAFAVVAVGCALTDKQIDDTATAAADAVATGVQTGLEIAAPGGGAAVPGVVGGAAALASLAAYHAVRWLLRLIQKKPSGSS